MEISAVIPAHNSERTIIRAIQSILQQTYPILEIIVVDDGSTDNTRNLVESFGSPVRYIYQNNAGPSAARNNGVQQARGEWIGFLDADDWWLEDKIARQVQVAEANSDIIMVYTGLLVSDSKTGVTSALPCTAADKLWPSLRWRNQISPSTTLVRRDAFLRVGGFNEAVHIGEDWDLSIRLGRIGRFASIPDALTGITLTTGSLSNSNYRRPLEDLKRILEPTLLADLTGLARWVWRRRIISSQLYSAGIIARENHCQREERQLLLRSVLKWPSPFWLPRRYLALVLTGTRVLLNR